MSIFRRGRKDADLEAGDNLDDTRDDADLDEATDAGANAAAPDADESADPAAAARSTATDVPFDRSAGPWDVAEVDDEVERLDLGALRIAPEAGTELRLEIEQETQTLVSVMAVIGSSQAQLSAFAAPRSSGIWEEIREEITSSVLEGGGTAQTQVGPFGTELLARVPSQGADGRTVFAPARFVGVDGPRWFLRAVLYGPAALQKAEAKPLEELVRGVVVVRGDVAMAPREMLPLTLPPDASQDPADAADEGEDGDNVSEDDLKPFERGPEITEVH